MNFGIYIDDDTGAEMNRLAELLGKTRNTIIREALALWIKENQPKDWSKRFLNFKGVEDFEPFEKDRSDLTVPKGDF